MKKVLIIIGIVLFCGIISINNKDIVEAKNSSAIDCRTTSSKEVEGSDWTDLDNRACSVSCKEEFVINIEGPRTGSKAVLAGRGFDYPASVSSTVTCNKTTKSPPVLHQVAVPSVSPVCVTTSSTECHDKNTGKPHTDPPTGLPTGGPDDNFDDCVTACDGGSYTQTCINKCANLLYQMNNNLLDLFDSKNISNLNLSSDYKANIIKVGKCDSFVYGSSCWNSCESAGTCSVRDECKKNGTNCCNSSSTSVCSTTSTTGPSGCVSQEEHDSQVAARDAAIKENERLKAVYEQEKKEYAAGMAVCNSYTEPSPSGAAGSRANLTITEPIKGVDKKTNFPNLMVAGSQWLIPDIYYINANTNEAVKASARESGVPYYLEKTDKYPDGVRYYYTNQFTKSAIYDGIVLEIENLRRVNENIVINCQYEVINKVFPPEGNQIMFRPIDLEKMFPDRNPRWNWKNNNGLIEEIQKKGNSVYENNEIEYEVTLTKDDIKSIRRYNKGINGEYIYNQNCESSDPSSCSSKFIHSDYSGIFKKRGTK